MSDDDEAAHAARIRERRHRAVEKRREQSEEARDKAAAELAREQLLESEFAEACVPWGWALDPTVLLWPSMLIGFGLIALFLSQLRGAESVGGIDASAACFIVALPIVAVMVGLPFAVRRMLLPRAARAAAAEYAWLSSLPFSVEGARDAIGSDYYRLEVQIHLRDGNCSDATDRAKALAVHASLDAEITQCSRDQLQIRLELEKKLPDWKRKREKRLVFRDLVNDVLHPLVSEHPIRRIALSS